MLACLASVAAPAPRPQTPPRPPSCCLKSLLRAAAPCPDTPSCQLPARLAPRILRPVPRRHLTDTRLNPTYGGGTTPLPCPPPPSPPQHVLPGLLRCRCLPSSPGPEAPRGLGSVGLIRAASPAPRKVGAQAGLGTCCRTREGVGGRPRRGALRPGGAAPAPVAACSSAPGHGHRAEGAAGPRGAPAVSPGQRGGGGGQAEAEPSGQTGRLGGKAGSCGEDHIRVGGGIARRGPGPWTTLCIQGTGRGRSWGEGRVRPQVS